MSEQQDKTYELDGTRPIADGEMEVADTYEEDGTRPIAESPDFLVQNARSNENNKDSTTASDANSATEVDSKRPVDNDDRVVDTFEEDGTRPIASGEMEIADTYEEDGTRPIGESPDFLIQNGSQEENRTTTASDRDSATEADGKRPVDINDERVVDTFEADGTRPIMENEYEVVDTLGIDGDRPITNESYKDQS